MSHNVSAAVGGVGFLLQPDEPVPNAQLTDASIEELVAALKEQAGPENATRLKTMLMSIRKFQQRDQQQQSAQPGSAPAGNAKAEGAAPPAAAAAAAAGSSDAQALAQEQHVLEAYLLPIKDKQTRKVCRQPCRNITDWMLPFEHQHIGPASLEAKYPTQKVLHQL